MATSTTTSSGRSNRAGNVNLNSGKPDWNSGDISDINAPEDSDAWYLAYIERYKGTDWYQRLLNNPYLRSKNKPFTPNVWQSMGQWLGDHSAENAYYGDLLSKRNVELQKVIDEMRQYKQDSPANQAARMAVAGQNADLLGTSGVAPSPENDNTLPPFEPSMHTGSAMEGIANLGMNFISTCLGFAQTVQNLRAGSKSLEAADVSIAGNEISNYENAMGFASRLLVNSIPAKEIDSDKLNKDPSYVGDLFLQAAKKVDLSVYSRRTRKTIGYFLNQLERDPETGSETYFFKNARAELLNRYTSLQSDTAEKRSHSYYSDDLDKMVKTLGDNFSHYYDEYQKLYNKYLKKRTQNNLDIENMPGISTSRYRGEMAGYRNAANQAALSGEEARAARSQNDAIIPQWEIDKLNNEFMRNMYSDMHGLGTIGGFASILLPSLGSTLSVFTNALTGVGGEALGSRMFGASKIVKHIK